LASLAFGAAFHTRAHMREATVMRKVRDNNGSLPLPPCFEGWGGVGGLGNNGFLTRIPSDYAHSVVKLLNPPRSSTRRISSIWSAIWAFAAHWRNARLVLNCGPHDVHTRARGVNGRAAQIKRLETCAARLESSGVTEMHRANGGAFTCAKRGENLHQYLQLSGPANQR
jgi:hypothetical protein